MYLEELSDTFFEEANAMYGLGFRQGAEKGYADFTGLRQTLDEMGFRGDKLNSLVRDFAEGFMDGQCKLEKE